MSLRRGRPEVADPNFEQSKKKRLKTVEDFAPTDVQRQRFQRGTATDAKAEEEKNPRRRRHLKVQAQLNDEAVRRLAAAELLLTESPGFLETEPGEKKTFALKQQEILQHADVGTSSKSLDLRLSYGPYHVDYTRNGKHMLLAGGKGSLAILDCHKFSSVTELHVRETVRDATFLHDHTLWAAAQKKYVYIYDHSGIELHCLREHMLTYRMEFLPYHFLLATVGEFGELRWLDVSTGMVPASYKTKQGPCDTMCQNPATAVLALGHAKGCVSFWTPNVGKPVLQFLGHKGKVTSLEHIGQHYIASAGLDGYWKVWDLRKFEPVHWHRYYGGAPKAMAASQTGFLGIGFGKRVQLWKNMTTSDVELYMSHDAQGVVESLAFRPYEDFVCIGTDTGVETAVIPGSCFGNFDSYAADPYETKKQRREREVHALLDKLPASTITSTPEKLGGLDEAPRDVIVAEAEAEKVEREEEANPRRERRKAKSKSTAAAKEQVRKKKYAELVLKRKEQKLREEQRRAREEPKDDASEDEPESSLLQQDSKSFDALDRFRKRERALYT